jgi:hypothetical protein
LQYGSGEYQAVRLGQVLESADSYGVVLPGFQRADK